MAMPTGDVCMIADPERCWAEEKRRKYLANQVGTPEMFSIQTFGRIFFRSSRLGSDISATFTHQSDMFSGLEQSLPL